MSTVTAKRQFKLQTNTKILIGVLAAFLFIALGTYYYFLATAQKDYLNKSSKMANQISSTNEMLGSNLNDNITNNNIEAINNKMRQYKSELQDAREEFVSNPCPKKYQNDNKRILDIIRLENSILNQIPLILSNPLSSETDTILDSLRKNITNAKEISSEITIPDVQINFSGDISVVPDKLSLYCEDQRRANKEKMERLNSLNTFFNKMDAIIQENSGAKKDLGSMLDSIRNGGYTWQDYFNLIDEARSTRQNLRNEVDNLETPKGTETLKQDFSGILTQAIQYCDIMEAGANLEYDDNYDAATYKYNEAKEVNKKIQSQYKTFLLNYDSEKERLTNPENL
jgi:hypothetical protein